ncbi:MAG TPA: alpha/beta hydrolase [Pseudonocardia sp.]|jgi:acetyl esterase/lipase
MSDGMRALTVQEFTACETSIARVARLRQVLRERQLSRDCGILERRAAFEEMAARIRLATGLRYQRLTIGGRRGIRIVPTGPPLGTVLYLHGGGYVLGSPDSSPAMTARFASATGCELLSLDYRLAPEHPYPAALEDTLRAYRQLVSQAGARPLILGGDSAGAALALAAALRIVHERQLRPPSAVVCLSPWSDLTCSGISIQRNADLDPQVPRWLLSEMARLYAADHELTHPEISPAFADLTGLPPLLVQISAAEVLHDDGRQLAHAAARDGWEVTLQVWHHMPHVWHGFAPGLTEATEAIVEMGAWTRRHLDSYAALQLPATHDRASSAANHQS